jgi:hypothetical protein
MARRIVPLGPIVVLNLLPTLLGQPASRPDWSSRLATTRSGRGQLSRNRYCDCGMAFSAEIYSASEGGGMTSPYPRPGTVSM